MSTPFPAPPKDRLSYLHFSHVSFAVSDGRSVVVIDPFFCGQFAWQDHVEKHLEPPTIEAADIEPCDGVFVSHEHLDHWDKPTIDTLMAKKPSVACAPRTTLEDMQKAGVDTSAFIEARMDSVFEIGNMKVSLYPSIESENAGEPVQRVGFLVEGCGATLYHQGDSHGPAKAWQVFKEKLDAIIVWPEYMQQYVTALRPPSVIIHHLDRFEPGNFFCNKDGDLEKRYWGYRYPQTKFVVPDRNVWHDVKTHEAF